MEDGTEIQATAVVNETKENVRSSTADAVILRILSGEQTVISHDTSQYQVGGISACGLAALNCARIVLTAEQEGPKGRDLLRFVTKVKTAQVRAPMFVISLSFICISPRKLRRFALSGQVPLTSR